MAKKSAPYEKALRLARRKSPPTKELYDLLLAADKGGDARATYALATWYLFGSPFTKINYARAVKLLRIAAKAGIADAAYDLAVSYEIGKGVRKSLAKAFEHYCMAALFGDAQSHYEVGRMYYYGLGIPRNRNLAKIWFDKAEKLGIVD